ncbi:DNA polymerase II large subunit [Halorussus lipolyticus]|uniref:DNA polymerase II large subunit n=1 Tax=Halorussus lipolyticus TaxID=3034024 RepID=UPI0023E79FAF|nr:DNA polymerase II large subunit [Halorussus sp. DT80]
MREEDERYFETLEDDLDDAFAVAREARENSGDPKPEVEIPVAKDMADRVENILGIEGVAERVRELEGEMSREEAALELAEDFAEGRVGDYETKAGKVEGAVRTAVALLTEGVVAAPIEGIDKVELLENDDGTEFVNVYYAGPIRSAGGTAQALSVLVADYTRALVGMSEYDARDDEIERYAEEINLYDKETGLQYSPKDKETKFIAKHMPIMLDGESTGDEEVSGFRDLERVDTNNPRGGMCLVLAEGIALKAPKIQRYTRNLDEIDWPWLQDLIDGTIGEDDGDDEAEADDEDADESDGDEAEEETGADEGDDGIPDGPPRADPVKKFLRDLIAGRPVFGHPSESGGFRLRYGRARNHGFATAGVHPATMHLVDDFLATGTQIKTERPGKAAGVVPVDSIEGPTVRLANGDVRRIDDPDEALELRNGVEKILDLGEYLVNYGEFVENNHPLAPASYTFEWWVQDFEAAGADVQALRDSPSVDLSDPSADEALTWATEYDCPLHPKFTYLWHDLTVSQFEALAEAVADGDIVADHGNGEAGDELRIEFTDEAVRTALECILVPHTQYEETIQIPDWRPLAQSLGVAADESGVLEKTWDDLSPEARNWGEDEDGDNAHRAVNEVAPFEVRERAPTRIGNRMGRPEKSEERELSPAVHTLFPIGEAGGSQRDVAAAAKHAPDMESTPGLVDAQVGRRECEDCGEHTFKCQCPECGGNTFAHFKCPDCDSVVELDESGRAICDRCEVEATPVEYRTLDINDEFRSALESVGERENAFDTLKGVKGLSSSYKTPEPIEKGILRAKHDVSAFKDGTVRYDMTDLPVTSVRPSELDVTADHFRSLGYDEDIHGDPLRHDDQLIELKVQDIVLSDGAAEHLLQTADFVDDLLSQYYGLEPFYEVEERDELVGELVFGMAPHTSAAVVGRIVGFTSAAVGYAHPYFHASKRRNCDGDEDCVMLLMDGLLNFSKEYLPDKRGGSVAEDSRLVAFDPDGNLRFMTFDEFWNELESDVEHDGKFRKKTCLQEGWTTYAFDDEHSASPKPIERAIRYQADEDEELLKVESQFGRHIEITENHSLFRYDDGIEEVAGENLEEGDLILAPRELGVEPEETEIDVANCVENPYVFIDEEVEQTLRNIWEDAEWGSERRAAFDGGLSYRLSKSKLSLETFEDIVRGRPEEVPSDAKIGLKGSSDGITRTIEVDEDFAWLLGLFVAEGSLSGTRPTIHNSEEAIVDEVVETATAVFDCEPSVRWSNKAYEVAFPAVFRDILYELGFKNGSSYDASEKVIPDEILQAPHETVLSFIEGFLAGDGSHSSDDNYSSIRFHTTSEAVKDGFVFLLHRLGLVANVSRRERDETRQPIYTVVVSGGAEDNPLEQILEGDDPYLPKSLIVTVPDALMELRRMDITGVKQLIPKYLKRRDNISLEKLRELISKLDSWGLTDKAEEKLEEIRPLVDGDLSYLRVKSIERVDYDGYLYDLQVGGEPIFTANWLYAHNSMDAPLVMSSRIDPSEIDDEAHNMDIVRQYPREFYEETREMADPEDVEDIMTIAEETLGTDREYTGFDHSHDTSNIALGPDLSAYKTLGSMMDKMDAQLELSRKLRSVDETDVAERVIEYHFLPDLIGNLRAFSRQETRCLDCGEKYRRMPLTKECRECGGQVNLTVHQGSVNKYMETAIQVAEKYDCREYTKQRLDILDRSLESIFENDKNKQGSIADFM